MRAYEHEERRGLFQASFPILPIEDRAKSLVRLKQASDESQLMINHPVTGRPTYQPRSSCRLERPRTSRVERRLRGSRPRNVAGGHSFFPVVVVVVVVVTATLDRSSCVVTWRGDVIQVSSVDWSRLELLPAAALRLRTRTLICAVSPNPSSIISFMIRKTVQRPPNFRLTSHLRVRLTQGLLVECAGS